MSTDRTERPSWVQVARVATITACVVLGGLAVAEFVRWRSARDQLVRTLDELGTRLSDEQALLQVVRERTTHHARLAVARSLVSDVLSAPGARDAALEMNLERLAAARREARRALRDAPGSSQAYALLGSSIYLERSLTSDPALVTRYADWEAPLLKATAASAVAIEARRLLAAAYLESWPALSEAKKASARALLEDLFDRDPVAFNRLAEPWIATRDPRALDLIPDHPEAWRYLGRVYARAGDWGAYCQVHERRLAALEQQLEKDLAEAAERLRLGDPATAREICLRVAVAAPPGRRFAPWVNRALELYPPGLQGQRSVEPLSEWLLWALRLDALGLQPLAPRAVSRLVDALGKLEPPVAAHAALLAGDDYRVRLAEQALVRDARTWTSYLLAKARRLAASDPETASQVLELVSRSARPQLGYTLARREVARGLGDPRGLEEASAAVAAHRAHEWTALDWRLDGETARLWLLPDQPAPGLELELLVEGRAGAAVEISWDGATLTARPLRHDGTLYLDVDVDEGLHLLEVRSLADGRVTPARVRLAEP